MKKQNETICKACLALSKVWPYDSGAQGLYNLQLECASLNLLSFSRWNKSKRGLDMIFVTLFRRWPFPIRNLSLQSIFNTKHLESSVSSIAVSCQFDRKVSRLVHQTLFIFLIKDLQIYIFVLIFLPVEGSINLLKC